LLQRCKSLTEPRPSTQAAPFRVLLVEDNRFAHDLFRHAVKRFYREIGHQGGLEIVSAHNGQEALEALKTGQIDLAVVDYFLPVINGSEIIRRMRKEPAVSQTPILVISVGGEGVREDALAAGADLYIDKPVMLKQLLNTLHVLLTPAPSDEEQP
jgi:CheY-like chemotaxis protein